MKGGGHMKNSKLENTLRAFYRISGMETVLISNTFKSMVSFRCPNENLCSLIHKSSDCMEICKASDMEHFDIAHKTECDCTYTCPFGITETILPIKRNGKTVSYIFCSMGVYSEADGIDETIAEHAAHAAPALPYESILNAVKKMPHLTKESFNDYKTLLKLITENIENDDVILDEQLTIGHLTKRYINNNLARKITLADISWNLHCSTVTLTEHFKAEYGTSITEYITKKRMLLSEKLLSETNKSIKEIALLSGFPDVEYFSRCFKKYHGAPPGEWRNERDKNAAE